MTSAIVLRDVTVQHGADPVLREVSLQVSQGEILAILGPSGSGKTTLLRTIMGFVPPSRGAVLLDGTVVSARGRVVVPPEARNLAVVFQSLALWPHLTVEGNLAFGLRSRRVSRDESSRRIARVLEEVGLAGLARRYPSALSGGEQQRVAVARALVLDPKAVLLDEPLSSLDVGLKDELLSLFSDLFRAHRTTGLYVTHDPWEARRIGDRVAILDSGRIVFTGEMDALDPQSGSAFVRRIAKYLRDNSPAPLAS